MRTKLAAVLVVPALALLVVALLQTSSSLRQAATLSELTEQVAIGGEVTALVHKLQLERDQVGGELAALAAAPAGARDRGRLVDTLSRVRADVAAAQAAYARAASSLGDRGELGDAIARAEAALDELVLVRAGIDEGWLSQRAASDGYTRAIEALAALLPARSPVADAELRAYHDLVEAKELSARIRGQVFVMVVAGAAGPDAPEQLVDARAQRLAAQDRFRANATAWQLARFDQVIRGQARRDTARLEQVVLEQAGAGVVNLNPDRWWLAATTELDLIREVERTLLADVQGRVAQGSRDQWRQTGLVSAATLLILLVSLITTVGIGRSMARSLRRLREQAMDIAHVQLPGLLSRLRDPTAETPALEAAVPGISTGGADEVGDVAAAFTQVERSAVELALDQAAMRRNVSSIFVNLARRSQVLVERQLELLDELERDQVEPDALTSLFRLDHLATRMRRNNESLLVLAGTAVPRPRRRPATLSAVALAAIAEIEQYQRVREDVSADLLVAGRAVADLVHLLGELLDNATSFSARDTSVGLSGRPLVGGGALVEISDSGIGMSPSALAEANALLAAPPVIDVATSERMGLVVVGHLAARHGVRVQLTGTTAGVRAAVWLPAALLAAPSADQDPAPIRVPALVSARAPGAAGRVRDPAALVPVRAAPAGTLLAQPPASVVAGTSTSGLPIRVPLAQLPANGAGRSSGGSAWRADDELDPEEIGNTLSRFYSGVRRAESESDVSESGGASGDSEP